MAQSNIGQRDLTAVLSLDVYKAIKMKKLDLGLDFMQIYCGNSI